MQKIRTVGDERREKLIADHYAALREERAAKALEAASLLFEVKRWHSLAAQAEALGLTQTADGNRAIAKEYEDRLLALSTAGEG